MPDKNTRDPRIDPRVGDIVLSHGKERTIYILYENDLIGWVTESPLNHAECRIIPLETWRKWAKDGDVILAVRDE